ADSVVRQLMAAAGNLPEWALVLLGVTAVLLSILVGVLATVAHRALSAALLRQSEAVRLRREAAESRRQAEHESAAKESAVRGAETERSRIERDLHDGVQPQLVSVAMNLSMATSRIDTDPAAAKELVAEAHGTTKAAITELRRLARGFHPAVLED
ncbi:sensor histidine kinase, partial [Escherichia coli]